MVTDTRDKIMDYIRYHGQVRVNDLHKALQISNVAVHRQLKKLLQGGNIVRIGKPPIVFYTLSISDSISSSFKKDLGTVTQQIIDNNFLFITPRGKLLYGMTGFIDWVQIYQKDNSIEVMARKYVEAIQAQKKLFSKDGWIDATSKLTDSFKETGINRLLFEDIYSYPIFGRTKLAKLVMYAKQTGEKKLIDQISEMAKPIIKKIIEKFHIEAVAYIPPTIPRPLQFMDELEDNLQLSLPKIDLVKVASGDILIPQKTLSSLQERIINARDSIYLRNNTKLNYKKILLIDDVAGSGASFNETAKKITSSNSGIDITAFALIGNIKGYDVIREI